MLTQLRALVEGLINRVGNDALEPLVKDYHDVMAGLEGRIMALEAKVGVKASAQGGASTPMPSVQKAAE